MGEAMHDPPSDPPAARLTPGRPARQRPRGAQQCLVRWARVAALLLVIGGAALTTKYLFLAAFDPHRTSQSVSLQMISATGIILGELLLPIGVTAAPAWWLRDRPLPVVVGGFIGAVVGLVALPSLLWSAVGSPNPFGTADPLRLRTEGDILMFGLLAMVLGGVILRASAPSRHRIFP